MGHTYRGGKSGCKMVTLFDSYSYDGVSAGILVIHSGAKSGSKMVTLFDSYFFDGVTAGIWVIHGQFHTKKTRFEVTISKTSFLGPNLLVRPHVVH